VLEDHEHSMTSEVMNSRDQPKRVSWVARPEGITGREFNFSFQPLTLTLLELMLSE